VLTGSVPVTVTGAKTIEKFTSLIHFARVGSGASHVVGVGQTYEVLLTVTVILFFEAKAPFVV